jgi:hypothetical protein
LGWNVPRLPDSFATTRGFLKEIKTGSVGFFISFRRVAYRYI